MGHKTTPNLFRLGIIKNWNSRWFADKDKYASFIAQDVSVRELITKKFNKHFVDKVEIERDGKKVIVIISTAKPGIVIGKSGLGVDEIKAGIAKIFNNNKLNIEVVIKEIKGPDLSAAILAEQARLEVERRIPFKKAMKKLIDKAKQAGAKGVKVSMAGRLNGVEIARRETLSWGSIPLHTMRADIDYVNDRAETIYGSIGIKVWVYKGLVFNTKTSEKVEEEKTQKEDRKSFTPRARSTEKREFSTTKKAAPAKTAAAPRKKVETK
ncbi:MAG: 30S ribosomal protein S3 [Patescibacteria group bacterium]